MADQKNDPPNERRRGRRISPAKPLSARVRMVTEAFIRNLSTGGALIESDRALAPGSRCELHLELGGVATTAIARVVRCHMLAGKGARYQSGLSFEEIDDRTRSAIEKIVKAAGDGGPLPGKLKV